MRTFLLLLVLALAAQARPRLEVADNTRGRARALAGKGFAFFGDHRLPILGRVSMDSFSVDISAVAAGDIAEGDLIELIGPHQSADEVAAIAGTIGYEILTSLGRRYRRVYL